MVSTKTAFRPPRNAVSVFVSLDWSCTLRRVAHISVAASLFCLGCGLVRAAADPEESRSLSAASVPQAMKVLYGNFDPKTQTSMIPLGELGIDDENQPIIKPLFHAIVREGNAEEFLLLTYAVPDGEDFGCHVCAPTIGVAVFIKTANLWLLGASNKSVTQSGSWGEPSKRIQVIEIGTKHHAIQIISASTGQGQTTTAIELLVPWKGNC